MSEKVVGPDSVGGVTHNEVTTTRESGKVGLDVKTLPTGVTINPLAKYVEATYTNGDQTVTFNWYESSAKATLYNTITLEFKEAQDTSFTSAEWT